LILMIQIMMLHSLVEARRDMTENPIGTKLEFLLS
jgi:hypothetical protein